MTKITLACCLCHRPIGQTRDAYGLDAEWRRRFPDIDGSLACLRCVTKKAFLCAEERTGTFVEGHRGVDPADRPDIDSWSHITSHGSVRSMAIRYPEAAIQQGARPYLEKVAAGRAAPETKAAIRVALETCHD